MFLLIISIYLTKQLRKVPFNYIFLTLIVSDYIFCWYIVFFFNLIHIYKDSIDDVYVGYGISLS